MSERTKLKAFNDASKRQKTFQDSAMQGYQRTTNMPVTEILYQLQDPSSYSTKRNFKCLWEENFCNVVILSISEYLLVLFLFTFYLSRQYIFITSSPSLDFLGLDLRIKSYSMDIDTARLLLLAFAGDAGLIH